MVRQIIHDEKFLSEPCEAATKEDIAIVRDVVDTLLSHQEECVGMAANMIGFKKRIIAILDESGDVPVCSVFLNPEIIEASDPYVTREECIAYLGVPKKRKRYKKICLQYQNLLMQTLTRTYTGWNAEIVQHEIDHCNGVLI